MYSFVGSDYTRLVTLRAVPYSNEYCQVLETHILTEIYLEISSAFLLHATFTKCFCRYPGFFFLYFSLSSFPVFTTFLAAKYRC